MKQEEFLKKREAILKKLDKLEKTTVKERIKSLVSKGKRIERLGGETDIPWRELERMNKGLGATPYQKSYDFLQYCWKNKIDVEYDSEEGGDTLRGFYTTYSNFRLKTEKK